MDIRRLTHLIALADKRNFARAAEHVHLSQPALTRSVQAAEAEFGMRLFDRGTTEVVPTSAGEFVLKRARQLVFDSRCLARDVELYREHAVGDLAFGAGPIPAITFLTELLIDLRRTCAGVNVRVEVNNAELLCKRLRDEALEFCVCDVRDLAPDPGLGIRSLRADPGRLYVRAGHPLLTRKSLRLKEVWAQGVAAVRLPSVVRKVVLDLLGLHAGAALPLALECDDPNTLRRVALATDIVLACTDAALDDDVASGRLVALKVDELPTIHAQMGIVTLRGRTPSPMAEQVIQRLLDGIGGEKTPGNG